MPFLIHLRKSEQRRDLDYFSKKWALKFPLPPRLHLLVNKLSELSGQNFLWLISSIGRCLNSLESSQFSTLGFFFFDIRAWKNCMSSTHLLSSSPIAVTMCMSLCGRKWGNTDHYSRSYQLALFLPLQSFCLPILEVWSPCLSLRLHSFSSCPQK